MNTPWWSKLRSVRSSENSREVVAGSGLYVVAEIPIDAEQSAGALLVEIGQIEHAPLDHSFPVLPEPQIGAQDEELRRVVEELRVLARPGSSAPRR